MKILLHSSDFSGEFSLDFSLDLAGVIAVLRKESLS
jgi:hypothetical protein